MEHFVINNYITKDMQNDRRTILNQVNRKKLLKIVGTSKQNAAEDLNVTNWEED